MAAPRRTAGAPVDNLVPPRWVSGHDRAAHTIRHLTRELGAVRALYHQAGRDLAGVGRRFDQAESEFAGRAFPSSGEQDDAGRDVSPEGQEIAGYFRTAGREVSRAAGQLEVSTGDLRRVDRAVQGMLERLRRLRRELGEDAVRHANALRHLQQASGYLEDARSGFAGARTDASGALREGREVERELAFSRSLVGAVRQDGVGRDVSRPVRQLRGRLERMLWSLRDAGFSLDRADRRGERAHRRVGLAVCSLQRALGELEHQG